MKKLDEISVFFPAFNLEGYIAQTVEKAVKFMPKVASKYEIIVVNDGSNDNTGSVLLQLKKKYRNVSVITHKTNKGYGAALKSGFYGARYKYIAFTDGDGQFDIRDLSKFVAKQKEKDFDMVIGYYLGRKVSTLTIITSKIWELFVFLLFGLKVRDIDCGFKLIKKEVLDTIERLESERGAFISSELLIKAKKKGFKIAEVGVRHFERTKDAKSKTGRSLKVILGSFKDLFRLRAKL